MSEFEQESDKSFIDSIKARIAAVQSKPLEDHSAEFEEIHLQLTQALSEIDGL